MDSAKERELEARLSRIESSLAALQRSVEGLLDERRRVSADAVSARAEHAGATRAGANGRARSTGAEIDAQLSQWFSSRSPEWWLSRLGVGFLVIAVLFLYGYAIDRGWITPPIRVLAGAGVGAGLFWAATRQHGDEKVGPYGLDLRQVLYGGALAVWYVTAYAAAVWYGLISISSARLLFIVLAIVSAWISLQERREVFAFIAVATGFATPFILFTPLTTLTPFALYLGTISAIGLFIYLVRGWQSTIWITFLGFWLILNGSVLSAGAVRSTSPGSITISVLIVLAGAAFMRVASLRRQLLATGAPRYTPAPVSEASQRIMEGLDALSSALGGGKSSADSLALWVVTILSPVLAVSGLANIWVRLPSEVAGLILVGLGSAAISSGLSVKADKEVRQVIFTAAALWSLLGLLKIAPTPESVGVASLFAAGVIAYVRSSLIGPRTIAKVTMVSALATLAGHALSSSSTGWLHWRWIIVELVTLAASAMMTRKFLAESRERVQGLVLGGLTYLGSLLVIVDILEPIWPPLVTASYAIFGAALLIMSRQRGGEKLLRQLGGVTMLVVVARLLLVDMASVDTIWRVLLFMVCGAVFLFAGYRLRLTPVGEGRK